MQSREKKTDSISNLSQRFQATTNNMYRLFRDEKKSMYHSSVQTGMWFFALLPLLMSLIEWLVHDNNQDAFSAMYNTTYIESMDKAKTFMTMMAFYNIVFLFFTFEEVDTEHDKLRHQLYDNVCLLESYHKIEVEALQDENERIQDELKQLSSSHQNAKHLWLLEKFLLVDKVMELSQNQQKPVRRLR